MQTKNPRTDPNRRSHAHPRRAGRRVYGAAHTRAPHSGQPRFLLSGPSVGMVEMIKARMELSSLVMSMLSQREVLGGGSPICPQAGYGIPHDSIKVQ